VSNCALTSAVYGEIGARGGCSPCGGTLEARAAAEAQGRDGTTVAEHQLRKNHSGERGPAEPGREGAHRRVSREVDGKARLTVALDGARTQRRPRNTRWTSAGGGGGSRFA
jgi:hypothetical protein